MQGFERRVENMVEGVFARAFRSQLKPVELGRRLVRAMDDGRTLDVQGRAVVPNSYRFSLSPADYGAFTEILGPLTRELVEAAREHARQEGYGFLGPVIVELTEGSGALKAGRFELDAQLRERVEASAVAARPAGNRPAARTPVPAAPGTAGGWTAAPADQPERPEANPAAHAPFPTAGAVGGAVAAGTAGAAGIGQAAAAGAAGIGPAATAAAAGAAGIGQAAAAAGQGASGRAPAADPGRPGAAAPIVAGTPRGGDEPQWADDNWIPTMPGYVPTTATLLLATGERLELTGTTVIGRLMECNLVANDPNVSRRHCELRPEPDGWLLVDLGSTNGTRVNGTIVPEARLADGDVITVGATRIRFEVR